MLENYLNNNLNDSINVIIIIKMSNVGQPKSVIGRPVPYPPNNQENNNNNQNFNRNNNQNNNNNNNNNMAVQQHLFPIRNLNPYNDKWTIKVKVLSKSDIKTWKNEKGQGKLFSFEIMDKANDKIRCTCFNEAVDKIEHLIIPKKVYYISKGTIKFANKKFNTVSEYEITLDKNSQIELANDDDDFGAIQYNFTKIRSIQDIKPGDMVKIQINFFLQL